MSTIEVRVVDSNDASPIGESPKPRLLLEIEVIAANAPKDIVLPVGDGHTFRMSLSNLSSLLEATSAVEATLEESVLNVKGTFSVDKGLGACSVNKLSDGKLLIIGVSSPDANFEEKLPLMRERAEHSELYASHLDALGVREMFSNWAKDGAKVEGV